MFDKLKTETNKILSLSEEEMREYTFSYQLRKYRKKELILREGEVCNFVGFINKGALRHFVLSNGEETTYYLALENDYTTDYTSFLTQQPAQTCIEALEDCEILMINHEAMHKLYDKSKNGERLGRLICEEIYLFVASRNMDFLTQTPETRYLNLMQEKPEILQRVPQQYIASYLGVKPESLSRIRRRLADGK